MYNKIFLTDPESTPYSLSNEFKEIPVMKMDALDAKDAKSLLKVINKYDKYRGGWDIDRDSNKETRLKKTDAFGNLQYLVVKKEVSGKKGTYSGKCSLLDSNSNSNALSNIFKDAQKVKDAVCDAKDAKSLCSALNNLSLYRTKWSVLRDTNKESLLVSNEEQPYYFKAIKESFDMVVSPDLKSTPMTVAGTGDGHKPTFWLYSEYGKFISAYNTRSGVSVVFNTKEKDDVVNKLEYLVKARDKGIISELELQELEERVRTFSCIGGNGNSDRYVTKAALEGVKVTTSPSQLAHIRRIQPLSHTDEANKKRKKTIQDKRQKKLLGI